MNLSRRDFIRDCAILTSALLIPAPPSPRITATEIATSVEVAKDAWTIAGEKWFDEQIDILFRRAVDMEQAFLFGLEESEDAPS